MINRIFESPADITGYIATAVGTCLMLPQIMKAWKTKKMTDVALGTVILYFFNCLLWLIYGIQLHAKPIMFANSIGLVVSIVQVYLKVRFD